MPPVEMLRPASLQYYYTTATPTYKSAFPPLSSWLQIQQLTIFISLHLYFI